jgi:hypothetical protein
VKNVLCLAHGLTVLKYIHILCVVASHANGHRKQGICINVSIELLNNDTNVCMHVQH